MPTYTYTTLNEPLAYGTFPDAINSSGQIVGYYSDGSGTGHGFLYSGGSARRMTARSLGDPINLTELTATRIGRPAASPCPARRSRCTMRDWQ